VTASYWAVAAFPFVPSKAPVTLVFGPLGKGMTAISYALEARDMLLMSPALELAEMSKQFNEQEWQDHIVRQIELLWDIKLWLRRTLASSTENTPFEHSD
jgi:hypothetical protein